MISIDRPLSISQILELKRAWEGTVTDVDLTIFDPICDEIEAERHRQNKKFPGQWGKQPPKSALSILTEEVGEVAKAINEDDDGLRSELVQVAAVAVAWIESLDAEKRASERAERIESLKRTLTNIAQAFAPNAPKNPQDEICGLPLCGRRRRDHDALERPTFKPTGCYQPAAV